MKQAGLHVPLVQTSPAPQLVPLTRMLHAEVVTPG
jgi:hypothetical protein